MYDLNLTPLLRSNLSQRPESVPAAIESLGTALGAVDIVIYLVDFGQLFLEPLGDYSTHNELPQREEISGTMAGRAFLTQAAGDGRAGRGHARLGPHPRGIGPDGGSCAHAAGRRVGSGTGL